MDTQQKTAPGDAVNIIRRPDDSLGTSKEPRMSHHTNSPSPKQSISREPTRWVAVSLLPEGNVLGVLYDPKDRTFTLAWVDDDPSDPNPLNIAAENIEYVADLLVEARTALESEGK